MSAAAPAAPALLSLKNGQGEVDKPDLYRLWGQAGISFS